MTKQTQNTYESAASISNQTQRTLMNKQANASYANSNQQVGASSVNSKFDDSSSLSSCSLENESMSMSMSTVNNDLMKAALTLTAKRTYPRRSAPTIATGRRNLKAETGLPREEAERRRVRRERNKQAATRCREKRNEVSTLLQRTVEQLEAEKRRDEEQLRALETMRNHLQFVLNAHESVCEQQRNAHAHMANQMAMHHAVNAHAHAHSSMQQAVAQPRSVMFGNTQLGTTVRPQTLLFNGMGAGAPFMHGNSTAITPASELLAFADSASLSPLLNVSRCFGQQLALGGAN